MRLLKNTPPVLLLVVLAAAACVAQGGGRKDAPKPPPNFSGDWVAVDLPRATPETEDWLTLVRLKVTHAEPELKVTRVWERLGRETEDGATYYTDGRGETNLWGSTRTFSMSSPDDEKELKTRTAWDGEKLVSKSEADASSKKKSRPNGLKVTDEWKLSKDGKELTLSRKIEMLIDGERSLTLGSLPNGAPYKMNLDPLRIKTVFRRAAQ
jgi:hypothetical protein